MNLYENNLRLEIKVGDIVSAISKMLLKKDTKKKQFIILINYHFQSLRLTFENYPLKS